MRRIGLVVALAAVVAGAWLFFPGPKVQVDIPNGLPAAETARLLEREGVVRSARVFRACLKLSRLDRSLKPGTYMLRKNMPIWQLLRRLRAGDTEHARVVIPEGFMAKQIADRLEASGVTSSERFMAYVEKNNLEGYLFPTTYFFNKGLPAESVAHHMHMEFRRQVETEFQKTPPGRFTLNQTVTLASIVQREAHLIPEMPMIAAVYINRLKKRMRLGADPTVQYALGRRSGIWKKGLSYKDLGVFSPYNTYTNSGLPPGPICSPGLEAMRAVLHPADTDAIYFVANNTGGHVFSKTLDEHVKAKFKAKRARRLQRQN